MNKDKVKQLRDALVVIKAECASYDPQCPSSCPFYNGALGGAAFAQNHQAAGSLILIAFLNGTHSHNRR